MSAVAQELTQQRIEKAHPLSCFDRWMFDGLDLIYRADFTVSSEVDMTEVKRCVAAYKTQGKSISYTHVLIRALALALKQNSEWQRFVGRKCSLIPNQCDIGVSISSEHAVTPVVIIPDSGHKTVVEIAHALEQGVAPAHATQEKQVRQLNALGWAVPGILRRLILKTVMANIRWRRQTCGTFQVSVLRTVDQFSAFTLGASGILTMGEVKDRVLALNGAAVVRPTAFLTLALDHRVFNGETASALLNHLKQTLTSPQLDRLLEGHSPSPIETTGD